jgi:GH18 family chitinase
MASLLVLLVGLLLLQCFRTLRVFAQDENTFRIAAYLPDYRFYINVNATAPFLTDLILFSIEPSLNGCCLSQEKYQIARHAQDYKQEHQNKRLRLWVTVGGGGRSDGFAGIAFDETKRDRFINEMVTLCHEQGLDGLDFDWEIPSTHQELQAYTTLLLEASQKLHSASLLISVALHARQFMPPQLYKAVDRIHLMAYDLEASHVAAYDSVVRAVKEFKQYGCPVSKMMLGLPAYGRHSQNPSMAKTFSELMDESSHEALSLQEWNGYRFDSPANVKKKVEFAKQQGMAGIFFWELGQDFQHAGLGAGGILLQAAAAEGVAKQSEEKSEL